jgi:hypothetical protein
MSTSGTVVNRLRTFCVVIQKPLAIPFCPIRTCTWKAKNGMCKYSREAEALDAQGLATLLGRPVPTTEDIAKTKADLLKAVRSTLLA